MKYFCPITYMPLDEKGYSLSGLRMLSGHLKALAPFASQQTQRTKAVEYADKLSIAGVQDKLSVQLSLAAQAFEIVERGGVYLMKMQAEAYKHLPENEDVTMRMARAAGIETPLHGLVYCEDGTLSYFIKRFDKAGHTRLAVEDMGQLLGLSRAHKYKSSMEQIADVLHRFCTFPVLEKLKLFEWTLFAFLVGNEDMHVKNFSLLTRKGGNVTLSPAYDLVSSSVAYLANGYTPTEELALPLNGKKSKLKLSDFVAYFGVQRLGLRKEVLDTSLHRFSTAASAAWPGLIENCFLPDEQKDALTALIKARSARIF